MNAGGIIARPIDAAAFAPFGQLLERPSAGARQDFGAEVVNERPASARANLALVRAEAASLPLTVDTMEHHPHSTQAFFPLDVEEYLLAVSHDDGDGAPDLSTLAAFRVRGTQGISYRSGIWHVGNDDPRPSGHIRHARARGQDAGRLRLPQGPGVSDPRLIPTERRTTRRPGENGFQDAP